MIYIDKKKVIITVVFFGLILFLSIRSCIESNRQAKDLYREFPQVFVNDSINNIVKQKFNPDEYFRLRHSSSISHLEFIDGTKISINTFFTENSNKGIDNYVEINDRIVKRKGSDTVFIYKNNSPYYESFFIIDTVQY